MNLSQSRIFKALTYFVPESKVNEANNIFGWVSLLCHADLPMFMTCMSSLNYHLRKKYPIFAIEDGSLTSSDRKLITNKFSIEIISKNKADELLFIKFRKFKWLNKFWREPETSNLKYKIAVLLLNKFKKIIYLDSDILFFKKPSELEKWIENNNTDYMITGFDTRFMNNFRHKNHETYFFRKLLYEKLGFTSEPYFNSALMALPDQNILNIEKIDEIISIFYNLSYEYSDFAEETIMAILFQSTSYQTLDPNRYGNSSRTFDKRRGVMLHYPREEKRFYFKDAIKELSSFKFYHR